MDELIKYYERDLIRLKESFESSKTEPIKNAYYRGQINILEEILGQWRERSERD